MATSPRRVCWDACAWIALIQEEKIVEGGVDRVTRCRTVIEEAKKGKTEIAISGLCLAEVSKNKDDADKDPAKIAAFFEHDYILVVSVDRSVGEKARELMMAGIPKLRPQDACHLATALLAPDVWSYIHSMRSCWG
jgi:predicted nucleic acid-binding protein